MCIFDAEFCVAPTLIFDADRDIGADEDDDGTPELVPPT